MDSSTYLTDSLNCSSHNRLLLRATGHIHRQGWLFHLDVFPGGAWGSWFSSQTFWTRSCPFASHPEFLDMSTRVRSNLVAFHMRTYFCLEFLLPPLQTQQPNLHLIEWNKKKMLKWVLTTKGLQIPRETVPGGTDFNTSTASAKVALSKHFSFTNTKRSPGKSSPPRSATPPATRELITMAVLLASKGSWEKKI